MSLDLRYGVGDSFDTSGTLRCGPAEVNNLDFETLSV
jgi:hypothetical protein